MQTLQIRFKSLRSFSFWNRNLIKFLLLNWWVICYVLIVMFLFEIRLSQIDYESEILNKKLAYLTQTRETAKEKQKRLLLETSSLNDPLWIELVLIRDLGVAPTGSKKIVFR